MNIKKIFAVLIAAGIYGMLLTYRAYLYTYPEEKCTAVLLTNEDNDKIYTCKNYIKYAVLGIK